MGIKKYTNFESLNTRTENEGKYILDKDFKIISKNEYETVEFGECGNDVMEVSIYDINNNLLEQKNGQNVTYIRSGDIKNYLYKISRPNPALPNGQSQLEMAIDAEKLLNDLGFFNGILKLNINFVRTRAGTENDIRRMWVQEISPSRTEIRILPLKTNNRYFDDLNQKELKNLKNLNKDFKVYKKAILDSINKFDNIFLEKIDDAIKTKYGSDFFNLAKKDFGLKNFADIKKAIYTDFVNSVTNYLNNRAYDITKTNFGLSTAIKFIDCDQYDYEPIISEIQNILNNCIKYNLQFLKRRDFDVRNIPQEFKQVDLTPNITNVTNVVPPKEEVTTVYDIDRFTLEKPINNDVSIVTISRENKKDLVINPLPPVVTVESKNTFTYHIENKDSRHSAIYRFFDATGTSVQKILSPGASAKICAVENSVSANRYIDTRVTDLLDSTIINVRPRGEDGLELNTDIRNFVIRKEEKCNNVAIGIDSPRPVGGYISGYNVTDRTNLSGYSNTNVQTNVGNPVQQTPVVPPVSGYSTNISIPTNVTTTTTTAQNRGGGAYDGNQVTFNYLGGYSIQNTSTSGTSLAGYGR